MDYPIRQETPNPIVQQKSDAVIDTETSPNITVGEHILNVFSRAFKSVLDKGHLSARVDLVRPSYQKNRDIVKKPARQSGPQGAYVNNWEVLQGEQRRSLEMSASSSWLPDLQKTGTRIKIMQVWDFPDPASEKPSLPWDLNFGLGLNFNVEKAQLQPKCRFRTNFGALHVFPTPQLEIRKDFNFPPSSLAVDIRFRLPLDEIDEILEGRSSPMLTINLHHPFGSGIHLSPRGLEFDERVWKIGKHTSLRAAAIVDVPRQLPCRWEDFKIHVNRLGLKTRLL